MWLIIARTCNNYGGETGIKLMKNEPIEEDIRDVERCLGGMHCIDTHVINMGEDEEIIKFKPDNI